MLNILYDLYELCTLLGHTSKREKSLGLQNLYDKISIGTLSVCAYQYMFFIPTIIYYFLKDLSRLLEAINYNDVSPTEVHKDYRL